MTNPFLYLAASAARLLPTSVKKALYRHPRLAQLIRQGLNRAAPQGLTQVNVAAGRLSGMSLFLDLQSEKDYLLGTYEVELQEAVEELVQPGMVAYDVGANIGYITLLLARKVGKEGKVFAFEALPANVERLRSNLELNGLNSRVRVFSGAVADSSDQVHFLVGPSNGMGKAVGSAGRDGITYSQSITVPGIALDTFVYEKGNPVPQVVKMDIEGGEVLALPGMRRILTEAHPLLLLELHGTEAARAAWNVLADCGYQICRMESGFPGVTSLDTLDWKAYLVALPIQSNV
jgi:FkbM family methyltransferase